MNEVTIEPFGVDDYTFPTGQHEADGTFACGVVTSVLTGQISVGDVWKDWRLTS